MVDENDHSRCVHAWMDGVAKDLPPEQLIQVFERGFAALWRRAYQTLGGVTLTAIVERVLFTTAEKFPEFGPLEMQADGLRSDELRKRARSLERNDLEKGIQFVLVEFLAVLGNLTAEILTPMLHSELSHVAPLNGGPLERTALPGPQSKDGEGAAS